MVALLGKFSWKERMSSGLGRAVYSQLAGFLKWARKQQYLSRGRIPWSVGYWEYRNGFVRDVLCDANLCARLASNQPLPTGYGYRLDERVIEYPWVISRLGDQATRLLDAGSALNFRFLLGVPALSKKSVVLYTLASEHYTVPHDDISYIYGDLRQTILRDHLFDEIVCISTLEHVGLDNTLIYTRDQRYNEARVFDYRDVLREFQRLLVPGGRLFLTVPYGKYENLGWLQQFDRERLDDVFQVFDGKIEAQAFYRYTVDGWVLSDAAECAECEYYDIHTHPDHAPDYAAAARAVVCLMLSR
jgi:hypothetical protein